LHTGHSAGFRNGQVRDVRGPASDIQRLHKLQNRGRAVSVNWGTVVSQVAPGASDRTQPADLDSAGRPRASIGACRSRTSANDRLPADPLGRVEGGDGIIEGRDGADVRPQSSLPHPLDDLTQLGTIELDNEVDRQAVGGPRLGRPDDGHQFSPGSNQACGPLPDVAADDIEHQIDFADVFQQVVLEVEELFRTEVERLLTVGSASGADDVAAGLSASCVTIDPTAPAAPCTRTLCPT
jgi:hypothetical protein